MPDMDSMPAGRGMDALVAEKVMGRQATTNAAWCKRMYDHSGQDWRAPISIVFDEPGVGTGEYCGEEVPHFSTSIDAAWEVVEKMKLCVWPTTQGNWFANRDELDEDCPGENWLGGSKEELPKWSAIAPTAPLAICLAALKVAMEKAV